MQWLDFSIIAIVNYRKMNWAEPSYLLFACATSEKLILSF